MIILCTLVEFMEVKYVFEIPLFQVKTCVGFFLMCGEHLGTFGHRQYGAKYLVFVALRMALYQMTGKNVHACIKS